MSEAGTDPYTSLVSGVHSAPKNWKARLRYLGPSVVVSGSIIGSGELILTSSLGAAAGFVLLWWLLFSCWSKSLVQAELARYVMVSADTYLRALNRVPGKIKVMGVPVSWTLWISLLAFIPGTVGMGGILGGAGQAFALLVPALHPTAATLILTIATSAILSTGSYHWLEQTMLLLVSLFSVATLFSLVAMQFTPYQISVDDLSLGFQFHFPGEFVVLALAVYGATGVNSAEISTYSYWCIEKGYAARIGANENDPGRVERARGWIRVMQLDVGLTLLILTCATVPFYLLGAGVLHATGQMPDGLDTVVVLSEMFTQILGSEFLWLFAGVAFCILFSSAVAGFGGLSRLLPDYLLEFGWLERRNLKTRQTWVRCFGALAPLAGFGCYLLFESPIVLLSIGALAGTILLPLQSGSTLWLHKTRVAPELRPAGWVRLGLWSIFVMQALLAILVMFYVILV